MIEIRQRPSLFDIDTASRCNSILLPGVFHLAWFLLVSKMVLNSNTDENIAVFQTWYGGILVLVLGCVFLLYPLVVTLMCVGEIMNCIAIDTKKMKWRSQAKRVQEKIIDRKQEYNDYAETKEDEWDCRLAIEHYRNTPNSSSNRVVWALVSKEIYDKYEGQSFINILYDSQNPDVFIVEGE